MFFFFCSLKMISHLVANNINTRVYIVSYSQHNILDAAGVSRRHTIYLLDGECNLTQYFEAVTYGLDCRSGTGMDS